MGMNEVKMEYKMITNVLFLAVHSQTIYQLLFAYTITNTKKRRVNDEKQNGYKVETV